MRNDTATLTCLECDHQHELPIVRGEYPSDDYCEAPEACEACGAPFSDAPTVDERAAERRQMGITF